MKYIIIVLFSMILLMSGIYRIYKREIIEKIFIFSIIGYFIVYILASALLFVLGNYTIKRTTIAVAFCCGLFTIIVTILKKGQKIIIKSNIQKSWLSYLTILILCIFSMGHFGFFGMGQDQGVYQTEAINLYYNVTDREQSISEYDELEDGEYKEFYKDSIGALPGFDLLVGSEFVPGIDVSEETSELTGMWHGIPTYASLLGLSAKMFGIENMISIQIIFYICLLMFIDLILERLQIHPIFRSVLLIVLGISPEIVWVKKSSLTECFLAVLLAFYLYLILSENKWEKALSVIPILAFSFFHVNIYTMIPIFIIIYWFLYLSTRQKIYLHCVKIVVFGYLLGFGTMWYLQPRYTLLNYRNGLTFISEQKLVLIPILVFSACIGTIIFTFLLEKKVQCIFDFRNIIPSVMRYLVIISFVGLFVWGIYKQYTYHEFSMLTLSCYMVLSGLFLIPIIFILLIRKECQYSTNFGILSLVFAWCILIYSMVMRKDIQYYYYYGRYLAPYLCIIVVFYAYLVAEKKWIWKVFAMLGVMFLVPFSNVLRVNQDDSRIEWSAIADIIKQINYTGEIQNTSNVVLLDKDLLEYFYFPLKAVTGAKVYPVWNDNISDTIDNIPINDSQIYYFEKDVAERNVEGKECYKLLYKDRFSGEEDDLTKTSRIFGLPIDIACEYTTGVNLYKNLETDTITTFSDEVFGEGWTGRNPSNYRWMNAKKSKITCYLRKNNYTMILFPGDSIPFGQISKNSIESKVYVNDMYVDTIRYDIEENSSIKKLFIPKEILNNGENVITFENELWSPAEYGSQDKSYYSLSIDKMCFRSKLE